VEASVKAVKLAVLLLSLVFGLALPAIADQPAGPVATAEQIALALSRLRAPARSPLIPVDSSCATTCGGGPQGSCTKSCPSSQSCQASCSDGKAICSCH
jgi:hypothetical protein